MPHLSWINVLLWTFISLIPYTMAGFVYKDVLDLSDANLKSIEGDIKKNAFRRNWLEEKDSNDDFLSDYIRKIDKPGFVRCIWCDDPLRYLGSGKKDLKTHARTTKHKNKRQDIKSNQSLPVLFQATQAMVTGLSLSSNTSSTSSSAKPNNCSQGDGSATINSSSGQSCSLPYGTAPNIHDGARCGDR